LVALTLIVDVPALRVKFVPEKVIALVLPSVKTEAPKLIDLNKDPVDRNDDAVSANPAVLNAPAVTVVTPVVVNPAVKVHPPPAPLKVIALARLTPALTVHPVVVALKVIPLVYVQVTPVDAIAKLPDIANATVPAKVILPVAGPDMLKLRQKGVVVRVQVYRVALDKLSKKTSSAAVGTAPAKVVRAKSLYQLAVLVVFQPPVPPPQYRFATLRS
jgi:hypothetical protein